MHTLADAGLSLGLKWARAFLHGNGVSFFNLRSGGLFMKTPSRYRNPDALIDIWERPSWGQWLGLSLQHLFSMFGSTVLVPILVGLNPGIALFSSGVGTLMYILITRGKIPAYMGSSFSFIVPMVALMKTTGYPGIAQGTLAVGAVYLVVALVVALIGSDWINKALPPIVVGPMVMVIGLSLAGSAAQKATVDSAGTYHWR